MTVIELTRSFLSIASDREWQIEVNKAPGDGTSTRIYSGDMGDERYMLQEVRDAVVRNWFVIVKTRQIIVVVW